MIRALSRIRGKVTEFDGRFEGKVDELIPDQRGDTWGKSALNESKECFFLLKKN